MLYLICGLPGTGKTTLAGKMSRDTGAVVFSLDEIVAAKYEAASKCDLKIRQAAGKYEVLSEITSALLMNRSVILDYGFFKKSERERYRQLAYMCGVECKLIYVVADVDRCIERVMRRNKKADNIHYIDESIFRTLCNEFETPSGESEVIVDTSAPSWC